MKKQITKKPVARKPTTKPATKANGKSPTKAKPAAKDYGMFKGKKLYPTKAVAKENPRRATAKDRSGKERESNGHRALEFIRKNPGATYEQFLAAKLRPADLRWDVKLGRVEVRA